MRPSLDDLPAGHPPGLLARLHIRLMGPQRRLRELTAAVLAVSAARRRQDPAAEDQAYGRFHALRQSALPKDAAQHINQAFQEAIEQKRDTVALGMMVGLGASLEHTGLSYHEPPLFLALQGGEPGIALCLLTWGASPYTPRDGCRNTGWSLALGQFLAAPRADIDKWKPLLEHLFSLPVKSSITPSTPIWWFVAQEANLALLQRCHAAGSSFREKGPWGQSLWDVLVSSLPNNPAPHADKVLRCVQWLHQEAGVPLHDPAAPERNLLHLAVRFEHVQLAQWLVKMGYPLASRGRFRNDSVDCFRTLPHVLSMYHEPEAPIAQAMLPHLPMECWSWENSDGQTPVHNPQGYHLKHDRWARAVEAYLLNNLVDAPQTAVVPARRRL